MGTIAASKTLIVNPNPTVNAGAAIAAICQGGTTAVQEVHLVAEQHLLYGMMAELAEPLLIMED